MDFKDLSYVTAIARHQSITKAARELYVSQPTLTKFLQMHERQLGQKLFNKVGNKFILTYAGERYVARAKEILRLKQEMDVEMADIIKSDRDILRIGYPRVRGTYMLPLTLPRFREQYPNVKLLTSEEPSPLLEKMLLEGTLDLAFFNRPVKSSGLDVQEICPEELLLVMSREHPLAGLGQFHPDCRYPWFDPIRLSGATFIIQCSGQKTRLATDRFFHDYKIQPGELLEANSLYTAAALASQNCGIAIISETHIKHMNLPDNMACFSFGNPSIFLDFIVAYRKGSCLSRHEAAYIDLVRQLCTDGPL